MIWLRVGADCATVSGTSQIRVASITSATLMLVPAFTSVHRDSRSSFPRERLLGSPDYLTRRYTVQIRPLSKSAFGFGLVSVISSPARLNDIFESVPS